MVPEAGLPLAEARVGLMRICLKMIFHFVSQEADLWKIKGQI